MEMGDKFVKSLLSFPHLVFFLLSLFLEEAHFVVS